MRQLRAEKPKARANEPKPPRLTPPDEASDVVAEEAWDDESPPKKLKCDDRP